MKNSRISNIEVKKINKNKIFRYVLKNEKVSNQEAAYELNVSVPTVLQNINQLIEEGLVEDAGLMESTGGRKAKAVSPIPQARLALGVDITKNHIGLVAIDLKGTILDHIRISKSFEWKEEYFKSLSEILEEFIKQNHINKEIILGVGISIPGIVNQKKKLIEYSHILGSTNISCKEFSKYISYPCIFINDASAAGWAELHSKTDDKIAFYFSLSNSVGGSLLIENDLLQGNNTRSGEIGHMTIVPDGLKCYCGKIGCLDSYCSAKVLEQNGKYKLADFFNQLSEKEDTCLEIWEKYLSYLAIAINNVRMLVDSDVILGGYVGCYMEDYLDDLRKRVALLNTFEQDGSYISLCNYKIEAAAVGAALQFITKFIDEI